MIVDTSGLFCCFDEGDARHDDAVTFFQFILQSPSNYPFLNLGFHSCH